MVFIDARIPVFLAEAADPAIEGVFWLVEDAVAAPWAEGEAGHAPACACCVGRSAVGEILGRLVRARAVGEVPFFARLGVVPTNALSAAAVEAALQTDAVASASYRMVPQSAD